MQALLYLCTRDYVRFDETEMRKQVEQSAGCFTLTAQEAPETNRKMREDLYKKTMSADGIAGRRPYGMSTRMIELVGWKRYELNRFLRFYGVPEKNVESILRRSLVWKPMARFINEDVIASTYPDADKDGYFCKDDTLKEFLRSGPCVAAALKTQHGFEVMHSRLQCAQMIEDYAAKPFTEDRIRAACGLPKRVRSADCNLHLQVPLDAPSQDDETEKTEKDGLKAVALAIEQECIERQRCVLTKGMFTYLALPPEHPQQLDQDTIWSKLLEERLLIPSRPVGKFKDGAIPAILSAHKLSSIIDIDVPATETRHTELHDYARLHRYAKASADREANALLLVASWDAQIKDDKPKGSGKSKQSVVRNLEKLKAKRNKLSMAEENLAALCDLPGTEAASSTAPPKRRKTMKGNAASGDTQRSSFCYERNFQNLIRTRAYVQGYGAQKFSRRLIAVLCPMTTDYDIQNAVFVILDQLVRRLDVAAHVPQSVLDILRRCANDRSGICADELKVSTRQGKVILHEMLFGGSVPPDRATNSFLLEFQKLSLYLRWLACSLLPETYECLKSMHEKKNPEASTLFYLYAAAEDYILSAWEACVTKMKPTHVSLHFDGIRCAGLDTSMTEEELCQHFQEAIDADTGFKVAIVVKKHQLLSELLFGSDAQIERLEFATCLTAAGNCICLASSVLFPDRLSAAKAYLEEDTPQNADAKRMGSRSYESVFTALKLRGMPSMTTNFQVGGKYLLHMENGGRPHCIACEVQSSDAVLLTDWQGRVQVSLPQLLNAMEDATDACSVVAFRMFLREPGRDEAETDVKDSLAMLLGLHAGAGDDEWTEAFTHDAECVEQAWQ